MIGRLVPMTISVTPTEWFIAFRPASTSRLARFLAWGFYKHVSCFGYVQGANAWLFFDPGLFDIAVTLVPDGDVAEIAIRNTIERATVVKLTAPLVPLQRAWWPVLVCTVMIARLVGARSCALRPDRLLRDLLAEGAVLVRMAEADAGQATGADRRAAAAGPG